MSLKVIFYAYVLGGLTFVPLLLAFFVFFTIYTSIPVGELDVSKRQRANLEAEAQHDSPETSTPTPTSDVNDLPKARKGWLTVRRTFEESQFDGGYVTLVRSFLDARSKDPKRSRPKDMWYVALKGKILYLYEDEGMTECGAAIQLGAHDVVISPEGLQDAELFAKRNAICLKPKAESGGLPSLTKDMKLESEADIKTEGSEPAVQKAIREEALDTSIPWFIFVRSNVEMEDWFHALIHASDHPAQTATLSPLQSIFQPSDMNNLVSTLDEQPDVIPMRWLNALIGRIFYSFYRTSHLENAIIGRLMKKLSKVKRPNFLPEVIVTQVSVGNTTPTFSKPMLKELTKEGDASLEVHVLYKGEIRITVEATAKIDIGSFRSYNVKLVLAAVLKEIEGNLLVKVKRPPSNRIWYAFTQTPRMVLEVEPIVSDRQITWGMILGTIESRLKEIIQESIVMPNMDDIAFFESIGQVRRGGIWGDSARQERQQVPQPASNGEVPLGEDNAEELSEPEAPTIPKSQSLPQRTPTSMSLPERTTTSSSASASSSGESRTNRRKTWFSTVRSDDFKSLPEEKEEERGRSIDIEKPDAGQRSQSTPGKPESIAESISVMDDTSSDRDAKGYLRPINASRSSSRSSDYHRTATLDATKSIDIPEPSAPVPSTNNKSNPNPPASPTSSFLSTLRSRTTDKQTLSTSAKEAIRKWGWGVGKKEDETEGMSDQGSTSSSSRQRVDSSTHRARSSYADVRAAVEGRRKDEQDVGLTAPLDSLKRGRTTSASSANLPSLDPAFEVDDDNVTPTATQAPAPIRMQPQAKTMSIPGIHASHKGDVMSMGYVAPPAAQPASSPPRNPVYRLWKSPAAAPQETSASGEEPVDLLQEAPAAASPGSSPPRAHGQVVTPPPLPPRHASGAAVTFPALEHPQPQLGSEGASQSISHSQKSERTVSSPPPAPPPSPSPSPPEAEEETSRGTDEATTVTTT